MNRVRDLRINTKLLLLVLIPVIGLLAFAIFGMVDRLSFASDINESQQLVTLSVQTSQVVHELQQERAQVAAFLGSNGGQFGSAMRNQFAVTDEALDNYNAFLSGFNLNQQDTLLRQQVEQALDGIERIPEIRDGVEQLTLSGDDSLDQYASINEPLLSIVSTSSQLMSEITLSQSMVTYSLFLQAKELASSERAILAEVFAADRLRPGELGDYVGIVGGQETLLSTFIETSSAETVAHYNELMQGVDLETYFRLREIALNNAALGNFGVAPDIWFDAATARIDRFAQFENEWADVILNEAVTIQNQAQLGVALFVIPALIALALTLYMVYAISRRITNPIADIMQVFERVGDGDFTARSTVRSEDELGQMAVSVNGMVEELGNLLLQTQQENERMQGSVMKLLDEVSGVAEGDLTSQAEVSSDMTGAIADSFNFMIEQLRNIIYDVQSATLQVSSSANEVQATTEYLAQGSETQAAQIIDTTAAIDEMSVSIQQVSENASLSAEVGEQAAHRAQRGTKAVQDTIQGMTRIQTQVQETSKRIKRLERSSAEIGKIVQLIGDIADRTSILALNASIQAAAAGDAGRGFAVVAEEVERLAERSTEATRQISTLTRTIQGETAEATASMEEATQEVVNGTKLAEEAGESLEEIETVSNRLSGLIQSISLAASQQARGSETIARAMNDIAGVTQQTASGTKQAAVSISALAVLADNLRSSVSAFKLPAEQGVNGHQAMPTGTNGYSNYADYQSPELVEINDYSDLEQFRN
ncbi:MAG: nitrate- and nitrite sensing domain-containing protein [Chloroflexota bacterium]